MRISSIFMVTFVWIMSVSSINAQDVIRYNGSASILKGVLYKAAPAFTAAESIKVDLKGKDTRYGINKLIAGECNIVGGGRPLKPEEKEKGIFETHIFTDAYAFIVHPANPIASLTGDQLKKIMKGEITTWDEIGNHTGNIIIISPPHYSMHYKIGKRYLEFENLPQNTMTVNMTPKVFDKVKIFPLSLGWLSYTGAMEKSEVKILTIVEDGSPIEINRENVLSKRYPYQQDMFFYTMGAPRGNLKKFVDFMFSETGRTIIESSGFFPIR